MEIKEYGEKAWGISLHEKQYELIQQIEKVEEYNKFYFRNR